MTIQLVWFKRDLRLFDHAVIAEAARRGPECCQSNGHLSPADAGMPNRTLR